MSPALRLLQSIRKHIRSYAPGAVWPRCGRCILVQKSLQPLPPPLRLWMCRHANRFVPIKKPIEPRPTQRTSFLASGFAKAKAVWPRQISTKPWRGLQLIIQYLIPAAKWIPHNLVPRRWRTGRNTQWPGSHVPDCVVLFSDAFELQTRAPLVVASALIRLNEPRYLGIFIDEATNLLDVRP